jgi:hypothetical protein
MDNMKRILVISLVVILLVGLGGGAIAVFGTYSSGSRVGMIIKFSKKGTILKTYEGELSLGALSQGNDGELTEKWGFSVYRDDDAIIRKINEAMDEGKDVRLHYKQKYFQFEWRGDTEYFIDKVEHIGGGRE